MSRTLSNEKSLAQGMDDLRRRVYVERNGRLTVDTGASTPDLLELGALSAQQGRFTESNELLETVYWRYVEKEEGPVISLREAGANLLESTVTTGLSGYGLADYEKVYLHLIKARNYLFSGAPDSARVEVRRAYLIQRLLREKVEAERVQAEADCREKGESDGRFRSFWAEIDRGRIMAQVLPGGGTSRPTGPAKKGQENAYAMMLSCVTYLAAGELQDALLEADRARTVSGSRGVSDFAKELRRAVEYGRQDRAHNVVIFAGIDQGPKRVGKDVRFPNPISKTLSKVSFSVLEGRPRTIGGIVAGGNPLEPLTFIDNLAADEYRRRLPGEIARMLLRLYARTVKDVELKAEFGASGRLIGSLTNEIMEGADTRCWNSLPKGVYFASLRTTGGEIDIEAKGVGGGTAFRRRVPVDPAKFNVIQLFLSPCTNAIQTVALPLATPGGGAGVGALRREISGGTND